MSALQEAAVFLIQALFGLYISFLLIRMLLGFSGADFRNPISQFLLKITSPVLVPLRRFIPPIGKIDSAAVVAAIGIQSIMILLIMLVLSTNTSAEGAFRLIVGDLLKTVIWIYIIAMIVQAVMSWVGSSHDNPVAPLLYSLTEPLLRPVRRVVPMIGMIDLSPLVAILLLQVVLIFVRPLTCSPSMFACMVQIQSTPTPLS